MTEARATALSLISQERERQDTKFPGQWQRFASLGTNIAFDGPRGIAFEELAILAEEFGEVANAVLERDDENLTTELVQVAAVCVAWLETRLRTSVSAG